MRKESLKRDNTTDSSQGDASDADDNEQSLKNGRNNDPLNGNNGEAIDPFDALVASKPPTSAKPNSGSAGNSSPMNSPSPSSTIDGPNTSSGAINPLADVDAVNESADGDGYEVEEIIDHKYEGKSKKLYKIRWKGYAPEEDTWEPENSLSCPELIEKYLETYPDTRPPKKEKKPKKAKLITETAVPRDTPKRASAKTSIVESDDGNASVDSTKQVKKSGSAKKTKKKAKREEYEVEKIVEDRQGSNGETIFRIRWKGYQAHQDTWEPKASLSCNELIKKYWAAKKKSGKRSDNTEYEVEKIVGHKVEHGQASYWVKWKGYGEDANTWEAASTVHCPELIEQYKTKYFATPSSNGKSKSAAAKKRPATEKKKSVGPAKKSKKGPKIVPDDTDSDDSDDDDDDDNVEDNVVEDDQNIDDDENAIDDTSEMEWEVQDIVDERTRKGKKEYLIRWKGCKAEQDSWEPAQNVNCPDIIGKFEKKHSATTAAKKTSAEKQGKRVSIKLPSTPRKSSRRA